jgi:predicted MFS family arabinose efflux permease
MNLEEFSGGWKVLVAAVVGNALAAGTLATYSIGILGPALAREFHWGSAAVNSGYLMLAAASLAAAPVAGMLADRIGVRYVALGSALLVAPTYMAFSLLHDSLAAYLGIWAAVAVLGAGTMPLTWSRALINRFETNKGLALGLSLLGTALSGTLLKPYLFALVDHGGWRAGFIGLGCMPLISFAVAWFLFFDKPAAAQGKPARMAGAAGAGAGGVGAAGAAASGRDAAVHAARGLSFAEALRSVRFWILFAAVALAAAGISGALPNMESLLKSKGFGMTDVREMVPLIGLSLGVGRLGSSLLIDRVWAPLVGCALLLTAAAAFVGFSGAAASMPQAWAMVVIVGMTAGMESDVAAFLAARYFGARNYSSIYGFIYGAFAGGAGIGAVSYGIALDKFGNYQFALLTSACLLTASGLLLLCLGRYAFPKPAGLVPGGLRIA